MPYLLSIKMQIWTCHSITAETNTQALLYLHCWGSANQWQEKWMVVLDCMLCKCQSIIIAPRYSIAASPLVFCLEYFWCVVQNVLRIGRFPQIIQNLLIELRILNHKQIGVHYIAYLHNNSYGC